MRTSAVAATSMPKRKPWHDNALVFFHSGFLHDA